MTLIIRKMSQLIIMSQSAYTTILRRSYILQQQQVIWNGSH